MDNNQRKNCHHLMDLGEPSTASRTRTASSSNAPHLEPERPFKKARYVWQLKGKYHLKADAKKPMHRHYHRRNAYNIRHASYSSNSSDTDSDTENKSHNSNQKNDSTYINSLLTRSEALLNDEELNENVTNIDKAISDDIPVTLVKPTNRSQDDYLEKWQARQLAKSYVDNTINSLLELWRIAPFDACDLVENCENDEQVEDEGILMAIQSHGLQTSCPSGLAHKNDSITAAAASTSHSMLPAGRTFYERNDLNQNNFRQPMHISDSGDSGDSDDHFLTAAVSAAIQKKGLSNYNYG